MNKSILKRYILLAILPVCALCANGQVPFRRNIDQDVFIPKGQWIAGVSVGYSQSKQENYQFLVIENINGDTYNFHAGPMLGYAIKDDLAVGMKFQYSRNRIKIDAAKVVIDSETDFSVDNLYSISQKYTTTALLRYYIGLGKSKRFGFFADGQVKVGIGESKLANGSGMDLTGSFERSKSLGVGIAPGAMMFLSNHSAIEVSVGLLGVNFNHTKQITDQLYVGHRNSASASFKIDLFSISFGTLFYL